MTNNFIPSWLEGNVTVVIYICNTVYVEIAIIILYVLYDTHKQVTVSFRFGELRWTKIPSSLETGPVDKKNFINFISTNEDYRRRLRTM